MPSRRVRLLASLVGYGLTIAIAVWQWSVNFSGPPPDLAIWDRVGDQVRAGISPYEVDLPWSALFFYSPPWAIVFGATSWLPSLVQAGLVLAAEVFSLRYICGSWLRVGYLGLVPLTGAELGNGSLNLVVAAAVAMAVRGDGRLAMFTAMAKLSPILAVRDVRRVVPVLIVAGLVTLPFWSWWLDWLRLLTFTNEHYSIGYPISFPLRLAAALGLLVLARDRPWAKVVAAAIAVPALYSYSVVLLYPLVALPKRTVEAAAPEPAAPDPAAEIEPATAIDEPAEAGETATG